MKFTHTIATVALAIAMQTISIGIPIAMAESDADRIFIEAVAEHHGLTESQAMDRLAREAEAALALRDIEHLPLKGYAGAWFDGETLQLEVATSSNSDKALIKRFKAVPIQVEYSIEELERKVSRVKSKLAGDRISFNHEPLISESFIDYRNNRAIVLVNAHDQQHVRNIVAANKLADAIDVEIAKGSVKLSSGNIRAADGTRNGTWIDDPNIPCGDDFCACSIGAAVEGGYVTAGHCGHVGNEIQTPGGASLGTVQGSTWLTASNKKDSGWVSTSSAWTPSPLVNGYSDGQFSFSAEWGGIVSSPVGSTVCRYGQSSGGPDCGVVEAKNVTIVAGDGINPGKEIKGVTRANGICTDNGDSGGPYIAAGRQMQGTNIGGTATGTCPVAADAVFFQPISDTLEEFSKIMLTEHGPNPPTINSVACGPLDQTNYVCNVWDVDSQGDPDISWTSSTGHSSTDRLLPGTCFPGEAVSVDLEVSNTYGVTTQSFSLWCLTDDPI